ncbi:MAG: MG2 domain-containing protein [bacterium]|nr:MG2 domain-containing protein [bacterium]
MQISFKTLLLLILLGSLFFLASCLNKKPQYIAVNPEYGKYVSGYTSGNISRKHAIRIELAEACPSSSKGLRTLPDSNLLESIFEFEPRIKGKAVWINERVIEFVPDQPLPVNQFYTATFQLEKVASVKSDFEEFVFQFASYPQNMTVAIDGLRTYDDNNSEWQKLTGRITTSDFADTAAIKETMKAVLNGQNAKLRWVYASSQNGFYFYIDSIKRGKDKGVIELTWNGEPIQSISAGKQIVDIPAMGDFTVTNSKVIDEDDQTIELYFGEPIAYNQNLRGIITLEGADNMTYSIEGNLVKVYPGLRLEGLKTLKVSTGIKSVKGFHMNQPYSEGLIFEELKPRVKLVGNGSVLPNSGGLIFPFRAVSLKAVDVRVIKIFQNNIHQFLQVNDLDGEDGLTRVGKVIAEKKIELNEDKTKNLKQWNTHVIDLGTLINPDPGAIYRVSIKFNKSYALCNCDEEETTEEEETESSSNSVLDRFNSHWNENNWDRYSFDGGYENWGYYYTDNYSTCDDNYYDGKAVSRNILASDLGMIYKLDEDKTAHAFISNLITAQPVGNCEVTYFDYAKQIIAKGLTNAEGMMDVQLKEKPFLMVASSGKQRGYLKLLDGNANSLSKFDVEGEVVQKGIKGFIYGERGVWRPGDSLYLNFILEDKEKKLPANYPVKFELQDPNGKIVYQQAKSENVHGLYDFRTATSDEAVTGTYMAVAKIGNRSFTKNVKIETVKPNRLKIYFDLKQAKINANKSDTIAQLRALWLHGAIAKNLRAVVNVSLSQTETKFDGYHNFVFDSPLRTYYGDEIMLYDGHLNEAGNAGIVSGFSAGKTAPGLLRANFVTRVFEEGGDFSVDRFSAPYSPYTTYVGLRTPDTKNNPLSTSSSHLFEIATVNADGAAVNADQVQLKIYKLQWRWWYEDDEDDMAAYVSRSSAIVIKDSMIKTLNGKAQFKFRVGEEDYGRYLVTVSDIKGGHQTGKVVVVDWPSWSRGNRTGHDNSTMLNFSCDKTQYTVGENIQLSFPSSAAGKALVSIETGSRVIKKTWINTQAGETKYTFKATADMSPNAYVHVTLVQPHANTKNDLPIRMYGVISLNIDDPKTHLKPLLVMANVWEPERKVNVVVKELQGQPMAYTLAIVDEGLLDLTRFKTPEPWQTFYAKEALGVKTWDMYDAVIGAYAGKLDKLLSIGGDGDGLSGKGVKANRFKPMVKFIGPYYLSAGQQKSHAIELPNYSGSVRVMIVAQNEGAYGSAEKTVAVKKPLMVIATLPRVLGPKESVYLPVDIFAMEQHVKDVKVEIQVNEFLTIDGSNKQNCFFKTTGDEVLNFKLNVAEKTGVARVKIIATSGKEKATQTIELDVRIANPKVTVANEYLLQAGKSISDIVKYTGLSGTNQMVVEVSNRPSIGLDKRMDYLISYPHGCIEQTTSSVFPQLFVSNLMDLKTTQKDRIAKNIRAGLRRLQLFQTSNGGFSYWPGEIEESEWGSNYAGHFMLEAEKSGYSLPVNMKSKWVKFQTERAKNWDIHNNTYYYDHGEASNQHIQAYRLYVLALAGSAELGAMNRMREEKGLALCAQWRLAAAYYLAGQTEVANKLIKNIPYKIEPYKELSWSYGSNYRDEAMILETLTLMKETSKSAELVQKVVQRLNANEWMSTQEVAYNLLALCEYTNARDYGKGFEYAITMNGSATQKMMSKKSISSSAYSDYEIANNSAYKISNSGTAPLYVKVMTAGIPLMDNQTASQHDLVMHVVYKNMKGQEIQPDKIIQGTDFMAEVKITNPGRKGMYQEMTLNQIFASGWEIHNDRMDGQGGGLNEARYQDIRDDRVYSYYELAANTTKTFTIKLNATYLGKFYLPTVYSEAMYNHAINASLPGRWVEVIKDPGRMAMK